MFVTRHSPVTDSVLKDQLWTLYTRAYARTAEEAVTHEMLDRLEFNDQLSDATNRAWVVWEDNMPVAMTQSSLRGLGGCRPFVCNKGCQHVHGAASNGR